MNSTPRFYHHPHFKLLLLAVGAGALLTFVLHNFELNFFEASLYDFRMRNKGSNHTAEHVVLVKIDDATIEKLNEFSPLSLKRHVNLLTELGNSKPKAIAYFINFNDSIIAATNESEALFQTHAEEFVTTADAIYDKGTPVLLGSDVDLTGEVVPPFPLSKLPHRVARIHKDENVFSGDKVTRRAIFSIYDEPTLHVRLAGMVNSKTSPKDYRGIYQMEQADISYFFINYDGATQQGAFSFKEVSAIDVLDKKIPPSFFADKIVLVGTRTKDDSNDYVYTPYSRNLFSNSKLTVHANIIETLIHNNAIIKTSKNFDIFISLFLTSLIIAMVFRTTPVSGVVITIFSTAVVLGLALAAFSIRGIWIPVAHPLMGIFFAYYVFVPYRLIMEYKTRWQFQKKNEVLVQVEELKSNFMSLITHDLKTPVARIQGMAEVLGRSGADANLVSEILNSTDELNRFITGILELAKIESNRIELQKQSKDVNKVIEDCVRKFEFQAREKQILVTTDLEPLFPVKIDVSLITKVLSNLIDNAIKYSPNSAHITIKSKESSNHPGFVEITIADTGHGISKKDLENLFSKFYRPKNDITLQIKGTGLGLYLSRYFVELHRGTLTATSTEGRGSIFTVLLPLNDLDEQEEDQTKKSQRSRHTQGENAYV